MYHLGLFQLMRIFGILFAAGSVLAAASNVPRLIRAGDAGEWAINLAAGVGFLAVGFLLYIGSGRALNQYRSYVDARTD
jgi:hypothetical protein